MREGEGGRALGGFGRQKYRKGAMRLRLTTDSGAYAYFAMAAGSSRSEGSAGGLRRRRMGLVVVGRTPAFPRGFGEFYAAPLRRVDHARRRFRAVIAQNSLQPSNTEEIAHTRPPTCHVNYVYSSDIMYELL